MAVYTEISLPELSDFLRLYDVGDAVSFEGIAVGVSNTNYHVFTDRGRFVLTIFEPHRTDATELPFFFAFANHLSSRGISCPCAIPARDGASFKMLAGKPAALLPFLIGADVPRGQTGPDHCRAMGIFTARLHDAALDFPLQKDNRWQVNAWRPLANDMMDRLDDFLPGLRRIIKQELEYAETSWPDNIPRGAIHADLFPDNIFFTDGKITAVIDLYFACTEALMFDLGIVVNAWCFDENHQLIKARFEALIEGYETLRSLTGDEKFALAFFCRATALRYLLSRLQEWFAYDPAQVTMQPHDPREYLLKLEYHRAHDIWRG